MIRGVKSAGFQSSGPLCERGRLALAWCSVFSGAQPCTEAPSPIQCPGSAEVANVVTGLPMSPQWPSFLSTSARLPRDGTCRSSPEPSLWSWRVPCPPLRQESVSLWCILLPVAGGSWRVGSSAPSTATVTGMHCHLPPVPLLDLSLSWAVVRASSLIQPTPSEDTLWACHCPGHRGRRRQPSLRGCPWDRSVCGGGTRT